MGAEKYNPPEIPHIIEIIPRVRRINIARYAQRVQIAIQHSPYRIRTLLDSLSLEQKRQVMNYINEHKFSLLDYAVHSKCNYLTMRTLIDLGADVNASNGYGFTPLQMAILSGAVTQAEFLRLHGANPLVCDNIKSTLLHLALFAEQHKLRTLNWILKNTSVDINQTDDIAKTTLHYAIAVNDAAIVYTLLMNGAHIAALDLSFAKRLDVNEEILQHLEWGLHRQSTSIGKNPERSLSS